MSIRTLHKDPFNPFRRQHPDSQLRTTNANYPYQAISLITSLADRPYVIYRGGEEVLLDVGGQDATEAFEDVGHSDEAREILDGLKVGKLKRVVR
jgi:Cytochrome b5-like Heme/Steroid binding domain